MIIKNFKLAVSNISYLFIFKGFSVENNHVKVSDNEENVLKIKLLESKQKSLVIEKENLTKEIHILELTIQNKEKKTEELKQEIEKRDILIQIAQQKTENSTELLKKEKNKQKENENKQKEYNILIESLQNDKIEQQSLIQKLKDKKYSVKIDRKKDYENSQSRMIEKINLEENITKKDLIIYNQNYEIEKYKKQKTELEENLNNTIEDFQKLKLNVNDNEIYIENIVSKNQKQEEIILFLSEKIEMIIKVIGSISLIGLKKLPLNIISIIFLVLFFFLDILIERFLRCCFLSLYKQQGLRFMIVSLISFVFFIYKIIFFYSFLSLISGAQTSLQSYLLVVYFFISLMRNFFCYVLEEKETCLDQSSLTIIDKYLKDEEIKNLKEVVTKIGMSVEYKSIMYLIDKIAKVDEDKITTKFEKLTNMKNCFYTKIFTKREDFLIKESIDKDLKTSEVIVYIINSIIIFYCFLSIKKYTNSYLMISFNVSEEIVQSIKTSLYIIFATYFVLSFFSLYVYVLGYFLDLILSSLDSLSDYFNVDTYQYINNTIEFFKKIIKFFVFNLPDYQNKTKDGIINFMNNKSVGKNFITNYNKFLEKIDAFFKKLIDFFVINHKTGTTPN
jgi:hypothetical protein